MPASLAGAGSSQTATAHRFHSSCYRPFGDAATRFSTFCLTRRSDIAASHTYSSSSRHHGLACVGSCISGFAKSVSGWSGASGSWSIDSTLRRPRSARSRYIRPHSGTMGSCSTACGSSRLVHPGRRRPPGLTRGRGSPRVARRRVRYRGRSSGTATGLMRAGSSSRAAPGSGDPPARRIPPPARR
jgi:hypothetical protein